MKKIKLTEDQLNRLVLTEGMYDQIKVIYDMVSTNPNIKTHPAADVDYTTISADLYDAVKGVGTTKDKILNAFNQIPDLPSLLKLKNTFRTNYGTDLLGWLDDDIDMDRTWNTYVYQPMIRMRNRSQELKHLEVEKSKTDVKMDPQVIENFKAKFPCIEETPGFQILRAEKTQDNKQQLRFKSSYGAILLQLNGVAWTWKNDKWVQNSQPLACPADAATAAINEDQINEQGLQGFDQQDNTQQSTGTTQNDNTQQSTGSTQNDNTQQSTGTTQNNSSQQSGGNWVSNFQQQLKDAGYGSQLGTTGPNGDGVDGKLGPKTATAAYSLLKSKGIINETTVFKDEEDLKAAVEAHLSEEKEVCGCGCEIGKCECGPECTKCDCGKKKEAKEEWEPTGSVGVSGVSQDAARRGTNTLWENEMGVNGIHQEPFFGAHPGIGWTGASGYNYGKIDFESEMPGVFKTVEVESLEQAQQALGLSDSEFRNLIGSKWYGANPENLFSIFKNNRGNLILKIRNKKEDEEKIELNTDDDFKREQLYQLAGRESGLNESIKNFKRLIR